MFEDITHVLSVMILCARLLKWCERAALSF